MSNTAPARAPSSDDELKTFIDDNLLEVDPQGGVHLLCGRCTDCGAENFPRAVVCSACLSENIDSFDLSGHGTLYAFSVIHQGPRHWTVPYAVGYVDFPGGLRIFGHLKGPFEDLAIGATMGLEIAQLGAKADGAPLTSYVFAAEK